MHYANFHKIVWLFLMLSFAFSCHDNEELTKVEDINDPPKIVVSTNHFCRVKDENGSNIKIQSATFAGKIWKPSPEGNLLLDGKNISKYDEPIDIVSEDGETSRLFLSGIENDVNYQTLTIFRNSQEFTFSSNQPQKVTLDNDIRLNFQENSYKVDNTNYSGSVTAEMIVPTLDNQNHINALPQVRKGKKISGGIGYLQIANAFYLSIKSDSGQTIESELNIDGNITKLNSGTAKLWFFNSDEAMWVEQPFENIRNSVVFDHKKSGYYCIAEWQPGAYFSGRCHITHDPLTNLKIKFLEPKAHFEIFTTNDGNWTTYLPVNTDVKAEILSTCGKIDDINLNTFNAQIVHDKDISSSGSTFAFVNGKVKDCEGKDVTSFIMTETTSGNTYYFKDHDLHFYIPTCGQENFAFYISNPSGSEKGGEVICKNESVINSGTLLACNKAKESYFNLIIEGKNKIYWQTKASLQQDGRMVLQALDEQMAVVLSVYLPSDGVGMKKDEMCNILLQEQSFLGKSIEIYCPTSTLGCGFDDVVITHFGSGTDPFIRGYFNGRFWTKTFQPLIAGYQELLGEFQIKKEF
ncbi:MAG: hypothetical protein H6567_00880 [Lewinellaceae bacterium]|nr:hypothetical protein [Lewinellaceae bacterium]